MEFDELSNRVIGCAIEVHRGGILLDCDYRIDVLVEDTLILELKSVAVIKGIHEAQVLTYMKLAAVKTGLLITFVLFVSFVVKRIRNANQRMDEDGENCRRFALAAPRPVSIR